MKLARAKSAAKKAGWLQWVRSEADERAIMDGHWFDPVAGQAVVSFFEKLLRHTMGASAGKPFRLLDWQRDAFLMPLFGWKRKDGQRRYSKGDVFVAKKQGKSTIAAGIANFFLLGGGPRAEIYGVAHTREQASIIYREAAAMATSSPSLVSRLKTRDSQKRIIYPETNSFYQALAGEACARGVEGINPVLILFDEIHVQRSRELYDALTYASSARPNSLMLSISTVGVADQTTIWWEQYEYAKGIIDGGITDAARFALIYQADEECKDSAELRADPQQWLKAMPSLNHTVPEQKVAEAVREAENSPAKLGNLLRYLFNIPTASVNKVVPMDAWREGLVEELPDLRNRLCYGGLDMASGEDLAAFVLYFPPDDEEPGFVKCWAWCPAQKVAERERRQMAHYRQWVKDGWLHETDGNCIDHYAIEETIRDAFDEHRLAEVGFDKWNADAVVNPLLKEEYPLVIVPQTLDGMSSGTQGLLNAIVERKITHDGNKVLDWCLSNCADESREDAIKFSKKKSAEKIDCAVALAMAFGRAVASAEADSPDPVIY